jgi:geranylgeranyl pyrophosphate synthase|nr:polyprenyl synthetase family protein [Kofleriaceae bacterium]
MIDSHGTTNRMTAPGNDRISRADAVVHVALADGRAFSLAVATMQLADRARLSWASLADVARRRCATTVIGDAQVPAVLRARLDRESGSRHPLVRRALGEVLAAGRLPYPDTLGEPAQLARTSDGVALRVAFADERMACELALTGTPARCRVAGTIAIDGVAHVAHGLGTYGDARGAGHDRASIHLDDGSDLEVWRDGDRARATVNGVAHDASLEALATWTSHYTFHDFGVAWRLQVAAAEIDVELRASFDDQELVTMTIGEPLWRGRCEVAGTAGGRRVGGVAYLEQTARDPAASLSELFATIPRETRRTIQERLPLPVTADGVTTILGDELARYVSDFEPAALERAVIQPIREVTDRMGKAWRSYAAVMCYHALRGDKLRRDTIDVLLSLTEVIHVGSLIVDDIEDGSPTRRGGPACHVAHGVPIAINAGTFCYFAWQSWFARLGLGDAVRLQIYEIYFEFMRLAHLGQALDIEGVAPAMTEHAVATGDIAALARQMQNVYVFKTGTPAAVFARIGAIIAGGSEPAVRAIGELFEALGLAFQIMDDVQNLKGFVGDAKHGEDLTQAKVTMPVLEAMRVLDARERRELWDRIVRCRDQPELVPVIVGTLDRCGAFAACRDRASVLIETAWRGVTPLLDDSVAKVMLRSFCFYVVECLGV